MKKKFAFLLVFVLFVSMFSGCQKKTKLYVYNFGNYIDPVVNDMFEEEYNCKVIYEMYDSNEELYLKIKKGNSKYDIIVPSDFMLERMIDEGLVAKLDLDNIPNIVNIVPELLDRDFDSGNQYSVPYFWGTIGLLYNKTVISEEEASSWGVLWNPAYRGEILMYDSLRDTIAVALKYLGYSMNTTDINQLNEAEALLIEQKPLVLAWGTDVLADMLVGGEALVGVVFSGDAVNAIIQNPDLAYSLPKEGYNLWIDSVAIPTSSDNKELAEAYINFLCRDDISMLNTLSYKYTSANINVINQLQQTEDWANTIAYYPTPEVLANSERVKHLGDFVEQYSEAWERIMSK
jgi:spermidine/putrescine transport system substrate-binding protein